MATTLTTTMQALMKVRHSSLLGVSTPARTFTQTFVNGTASGQVDLVYYDQITVASSGSPTTLILSDGSLRGYMGSVAGPTALTFAHVNGIYVVNDETGTANIVTVGGGTNPFTPWLSGTTPAEVLDPGDMFQRAKTGAGWAVASGSADRIKFTTAAGTSVKLTVFILGRSA